jgi:LETM1 and EF-hand domain-containing protein 1
LLPSTFFKDKYDDSTLARKLQAKQQMAGFWQEVVAQRTNAILEEDNHEYGDKAAELQDFQEKLMSGHFPSLKEMLRFSRLFEEEMKLGAMSANQLRAMSKMLGLKPMTLPVHNQLQLRHHITSLRREDRDYLWEGIEGLTRSELIEACQKRAIRFHGSTEDEMRRELERWLEISRHKKIPTSLLLWIQSFSLTSEETASGYEAPDKPEPKDFQVTVEPPPQADPEPKDAFHGIEERQKTRLEQTEARLSELEQEIEEVLTPEEVVDADGEAKEPPKFVKSKQPASEKPPRRSSLSDPLSAMEMEQEEKQCILKRIDELSKAQELNRVIIDKQQLMLKHQLEFMCHMRDNQELVKNDQDSRRILLDQRVRLVEGLSSFKKDLNEIEKLVEEADEKTVDVSFDEGDRDWMSSLFTQLDMNKDGVISRKEFMRISEKANLDELNMLAKAAGAAPLAQSARLDRTAVKEATSRMAAAAGASPGEMGKIREVANGVPIPSETPPVGPGSEVFHESRTPSSNAQ